jgi:hypothetical protein
MKKVIISLFPNGFGEMRSDLFEKNSEISSSPDMLHRMFFKDGIEFCQEICNSGVNIWIRPINLAF